MKFFDRENEIRILREIRDASRIDLHDLERKSGVFFAKNPTLKSRKCYFKGLSLGDM